jgi:3-phenylpropionate/trans-cinnamate dioxygenase ferredoxin reductase subunit
MSQQFVIVGASLAGGTAAITLREEGFDGEVVLIGAEPHPPYERPPLSKDYLRDEMPFEGALLQPANYYVEHNITTRFGTRVQRIAPDERAVELADGARVPYDRLLIATGARARRLRAPGADLPGIYDLRTIDDADRIRAECMSGRRAVLVGMGFIGSEVAASLRHYGVEVTVIEPFPTPLFRVLGAEVGHVFAAFHREHGVELLFGEAVAEFVGDNGGRVRAVVTSSGRHVACDFVVVAVGVEPMTDVVTDTEIKIENGIVVDEFCRTNVESIYAAGDVANFYHPVFARHIRVEHWQNAINQGRAAARSMLDKGEPYDEVPWFWSDQYDYNVQYAGYHTEWDELVVRGSFDQRKFVAFYVQNQRIVAVAAMNRGRDLRRAMALIKARAQVDPAKLQDERIDLRTIGGP